MASALDHYALFGLAPRFALDLPALEAAYKRVQAQVHPDRYAAASAAEKRVAMQWATQANEAYRTLRDDTRRAAYLCERQGRPIDAESNTAMPPAFLMQQMQWHEALDDLRGSGGDAAALAAEIGRARAQTVADLTAALDAAQDYARAAALVRQMMFIDKLQGELRGLAENRAESRAERAAGE